MKKLRRQFGAKFVSALTRCPTLVADLQAIAEAGIKIRRVGRWCQAFTELSKKTIYIGSKCSLSYQLVALAHEASHAVYRPTISPLPGETGRQEFIERCLEDEVEAFVHEAQVVEEMRRARIYVGKHLLNWYERYKKGGREAVLCAVRSAPSSITGDSYPEHYGEWYDAAVKAPFRLPMCSSSSGCCSRSATPKANSQTDRTVCNRLGTSFL